MYFLFQSQPDLKFWFSSSYFHYPIDILGIISKHEMFYISGKVKQPFI